MTTGGGGGNEIRKEMCLRGLSLLLLPLTRAHPLVIVVVVVVITRL